MNKTKLGLMGAILVLLALFFWQVRQEANKPIDGFVSESSIVRLNSSALDELYSLEGTQTTSTDSPFYMDISEQQLIKKSVLEAQKQATEVINKKYSAVQRASVDFENHLVNFDNVNFSFVDVSKNEGELDYVFADDQNSMISDNNLNDLINNARTNLRERKQTIWNSAWFGAGIYLLFSVIGLVVLFNLEKISYWLVNLFVQDATPGPIVAILIGLSAIGLIVRGFWVLYLIYQEIL